MKASKHEFDETKVFLDGAKERLFVGIPFGRESSPDPGFRSLYQVDLLAARKAVRWVPTQNIHMTLRFIGEVSNTTKQAIQAGLREVRRGEFTCDLSGVGYLPKRGAPPRVLYVGCKDAPSMLLDLQRDVDRAVDIALSSCSSERTTAEHPMICDEETGSSTLEVRESCMIIEPLDSKELISKAEIPRDGKRHPSFLPHVTIARLNRAPKPTLSAWAERNADFNICSQYVDRFVLYRSQLGAGGAVYEEIESFGLLREEETMVDVGKKRS
eukprot:gene26044-31447_t